MEEKDMMWVVTKEEVSKRGRGLKQLKAEELSKNVNLFIDQVGNLLAKTPEKLGKFEFEELEVYGEITAKGVLAILGTGGEVGASGGLRFVFRRSPTHGDEK